MSFPEKSRYKRDTALPYIELYKNSPEFQQGPEWLKELRYRALTCLEREGLPTPKLERWKYTNLIPKIGEFGGALGGSDVVYKDPDNLVQKIGDLIADAPDWLQKLFSANPANGAKYEDMALWELCNLFLRDGLVIDVPAGKIADKPVEITISGHENSFFVPRTAFRLGAGAELTIIEYHNGEGAYWNNRLTQIQVGPNAKLRHIRIQENTDQAVYTQNTHVEIDRDGTYEAFVLTTGAGLSRNQVHVDMNGTNGHCELNGINMIRGKQIADSTFEISHNVPHCQSHQFIRSIIDDQARGVFQGKVYVAEDAQKTDGYQLSNTLLLSEGAEMDTKPELEIYADDVQCSHGATTGQLDDEPLFYLRSRGLTEADARGLLIRAFLGEVVDKVVDNSVQEAVRERVEAWLER